MAIVILSITLVVTLSVISNAVQQSADPLMQHKAVLISQAYFDEILTKPFAEDTPVGGVPASTSASVCTLGSNGESRIQYDDVDDYHLLDETPPRSQDDTPLTEYAGFRVQVNVSCSGLALGFGNNYDAKLVTVTVDPPDVGTVTFAAYRGNY